MGARTFNDVVVDEISFAQVLVETWRVRDPMMATFTIAVRDPSRLKVAGLLGLFAADAVALRREPNGGIEPLYSGQALRENGGAFVFALLKVLSKPGRNAAKALDKDHPPTLQTFRFTIDDTASSFSIDLKRPEQDTTGNPIAEAEKLLQLRNAK